MKLGFIGTGKIASSVITGICGSSIKYSKISISSRNSKIAKANDACIVLDNDESKLLMILNIIH